MSGKELDYIKEAFDENWIAPVGPALNKFEQMQNMLVSEIEKIKTNSNETTKVSFGEK